MFLTRLDVDRYNMPAQRRLASPYQIHQELCRLAGASRAEASLLHRTVDSSIYVYSNRPLSSDLRPGFSSGGERQLDPLLDALCPGQTIMINTVVVPAVKVRRASGHSRRVLLRDRDARLNWLARRLRRGGLLIQPDEIHEGNRVHVRARDILIDGYEYAMATVIADADAAANVIRGGVGSEKAFGFGMLLVAGWPNVI